jgi:hypothetical protein
LNERVKLWNRETVGSAKKLRHREVGWRASEHEFEQSVTEVNSIRPGRMVSLLAKDEARLGEGREGPE